MIRSVNDVRSRNTLANEEQINTQPIPPFGPLLASMPSGREVHSVKPFTPPTLETSALGSMRAPPDRTDDYGGDASSDEDAQDLVGAFPGTRQDYSAASSSNYY